jgi:hypothetical protein
MSLKQIWTHRKQIFEGITNSIFKKDIVEKIAAERMMICKACPIIDLEGSKCMVPGTQPCCGDCGCKLGLKTRSLSSECTHPDGPKWPAIMEQEEEDKLYKEIGYEPEQ